MSTLQQKSQATAAVLKQAQQDQFLNILLKAKAVKQRLHQKLVSHQLASERISMLQLVPPKGPKHETWAQPSRLGPSVTNVLLLRLLPGGTEVYIPAGGLVPPAT